MRGMKAIVVHEFGGPEVLALQEVPDPVPGPGQIRVRLRACGVNPYDTYVRSGHYMLKPDLPYIPGADGAGVIDRLGERVAGWTVGERVYIGGTAAHPAWGAYAELAVCEPGQVHRLPERLSFAQGAAIGVPYVTAWRAVAEHAAPRAGEMVFIHGASGAVGLAAIQVARLLGLTVVGSAGSDAGLTLVREQGAALAVDHTRDGYLDEVKAFTGGRGPDIVIEMLANVNLDRDLGLVAPGGRIVIVGNRGRTEIDARQIMAKDAIVRGFAFWNLAPQELERIHARLAPDLASGALTPYVGTELPLAEAPQAHIQVLARGARGKIVLVP